MAVTEYRFVILFVSRREDDTEPDGEPRGASMSVDIVWFGAGDSNTPLLLCVGH